MARRLLAQILETLRPQIRAGIPIVGLEPSCVAVFRDELLNFFPDDEDARRLSAQTYTLSEFLQQYPSDRPLPALGGAAIVQGHCHQKAVMGFQSEVEILKALGLDVQQPEPGCCGMAGAFGFEVEHAGIAQQCGERHLLPAVRQSASETHVVADGFSCREQIAQATGRRPLHLAELLARAWRSLDT